MAKIQPLADVGSLANTTAARAVINDNSQKIENAFQNTISRDGSAPNQMEADFDLNDHYLLNVADPVNEADGVNLRSVRPLVEQFAADIVETAVFGTQVVDPFTATAGQFQFTLSESPGSEANTNVFINGLALLPGVDFSLGGADLRTLTLTNPLVGGEEVMVRYSKALPSGVSLAQSILYTPPSLGIPGTVKSYLDYLQTSAGAATLGVVQGGTAPAGRTIASKLGDYVVGADFGIIGDGVTDDLSALNNAAAYAASKGVPLILDGSKSYALSNLWTIPTGAQIQTNGATFVDKVGAGTSNAILIDVTSGVRLDRLNVTIGTGLGRQRCVRVTGANVSVGNITVTYTDQQTTDDNTDAAVRFTNCTNLVVGQVKVTNHDRPMSFETCSGVNCLGTALTSYVRGLFISNCTDLHIGRSKISIASPNATITAGHCGVLVESTATDATRNIVLEDFVIENAGEHGIRISGPEQLSNVYLVRPRTKGCGASGIKILGTDTGAPTSRNKRIYITDAIIEDCGTANNNRCGILAQYCDEVYITNPIVRKQAGTNSSHTGIRLTSCSLVHILEPQISDALFYGIWFDGSEGNIDNVSITGGIVKSNADTGIRLSTGTATFGRINIRGTACDSNTLFGFTAGGNFVSTDIVAKTYGNAAACNVTSTSVFIDVTGLPGTTAIASTTPMNGSRWSDGTTLNIRKAGAWTAL